MRGEHELKERLLTKPHQRLEVQLEQRLKRLALLHRRILLRELLYPRYEKEHLHLHRLLAPERPIVVEGGDALRGRNELWSTLLRHARDEVQNLRLRRAVVPSGQGTFLAGCGHD